MVSRYDQRDHAQAEASQKVLARLEARQKELGRPTARCPFCEVVHPIPARHRVGHELVCACGAIDLLCAPKTEPETSVRLAEAGLSDTKADVLDETVSIVWARAWAQRWEANRPR